MIRKENCRSVVEHLKKLIEGLVTFASLRSEAMTRPMHFFLNVSSTIVRRVLLVLLESSFAFLGQDVGVCALTTFPCQSRHL